MAQTLHGHLLGYPEDQDPIRVPAGPVAGRPDPVALLGEEAEGGEGQVELVGVGGGEPGGPDGALAADECITAEPADEISPLTLTLEPTKRIYSSREGVSVKLVFRANQRVKLCLDEDILSQVQVAIARSGQGEMPLQPLVMRDNSELFERPRKIRWLDSGSRARSRRSSCRTSTPRSTRRPPRRRSGTPSRRSARGTPSCRRIEQAALGGPRTLGLDVELESHAALGHGRQAGHHAHDPQVAPFELGEWIGLQGERRQRRLGSGRSGRLR